MPITNPKNLVAVGFAALMLLASPTIASAQWWEDNEAYDNELSYENDLFGNGVLNENEGDYALYDEEDEYGDAGYYEENWEEDDWFDWW